MRIPLFSCCTFLLFIAQSLQGEAQSSSTLEYPTSLELNNNVTSIPSVEGPEETVSRSTPQPISIKTTAEVPNENVTASTEITGSPIAKIVLEGFVTNENKSSESVANATELVTMTDPTIETTSMENFTYASTPEESGTIITDNDLTLSFISSSSHISTAVGYLPPASATTAAIITGVFLCIAFVVYGGLVIWRKVLERRYGNRELLVNEEFYDTNGLKYFEL